MLVPGSSKFELLVQVRKVEALMQFLGFEGCVQFVCKCSWEGYGGGEMLLLPPESQLLTLVVVLSLASGLSIFFFYSLHTFA